MIDTHTHIYENTFAADLDDVIDRACAAGVSRMILPSCNMSDAPLVAATCAAHPDSCFALYGLHPTEMGDDPMSEAEQLMDFAQSHQPFLGIGEIGLDLHWDKSRQAEHHLLRSLHAKNRLDYSPQITASNRQPTLTRLLFNGKRIKRRLDKK